MILVFKILADYLFDTAQSTYNLLESLLNWAMARGGRFVYHPINFELKQSTKIVCDVLKSLAIKKNIGWCIKKYAKKKQVEF